jgi:hypothetical protein
MVGETPEGKVWAYVQIPGDGNGWVLIDKPGGAAGAEKK